MGDMKRWAAFLALLSVLLLGETVCAQSDHEPLTLLTGQLDYSDFIEALHEVYPEINIELISYRGGNTSGYMKQTLEVGDIPDIYTCSVIQDEALQKERLLDLSGYGFVNRYSDAMLDPVDVDGAVYLLPGRYQVSGICYNKTLFAQHGWTVPTSFEELVALSEQIREEAPDVLPFGARMSLKGYPFAYFFAINNVEFFGTPTGAKWKKDFLAGEATAAGNLEACVAYYKRWIDAGFFTAYDINGSTLYSDFCDGKVAMISQTATPTWTAVGPTTGETIEIGIMAWPSEHENEGMLLSNVARYYGLSNALAEPGNEQKLEDALKVLDFMATEEGLGTINSANYQDLLYPFKDYTVSPDHPLYEVHEQIEQGYTEPLVYAGWDTHHIVPMADTLNALMYGSITEEDVIAQFDEINIQALESPQSSAIAIADEYLDKEQVARLSAMAMIEYLDADAALVSIGGIYANQYENSYGINAPIYPVTIRQEQITIFSPYGYSLKTVELTGEEIEELVQTGRMFKVAQTSADGEALDPLIYYMPYTLTVRDDAPIDPQKTYTVVFNENDYNMGIAQSWGERMVSHAGSAYDAVEAWLGRLEDGHLSAEDLVWPLIS